MAWSIVVLSVVLPVRSKLVKNVINGGGGMCEILTEICKIPDSQ